MTEQYPPISVVMIPEGHIFHAPLYPWGSANGSQGWIHPEGADCGVCHIAQLNQKVGCLNGPSIQTNEDPNAILRKAAQDFAFKLQGAEERALLCLKAKDSALASEQEAWATTARAENACRKAERERDAARDIVLKALGMKS